MSLFFIVYFHIWRGCKLLASTPTFLTPFVVFLCPSLLLLWAGGKIGTAYFSVSPIFFGEKL